MLIEALSGRLAKALQTDSDADYFLPLLASLVSEPVNGTLATGAAGPSGGQVDGIFTAGGGNPQALVTWPQIKVFPYARGEPFADFFVNVYGWYSLTTDPVVTGPPLPAWYPCLLVQLYCWTTNFGGQQGTLLGPNEYLCDTITVTQGSLGAGYINAPAQGLPAYAVVDLRGAHKFQFDFMTGEEYTADGNALWAPASN